MSGQTPRQAVEAVLCTQRPERIVYAPNYWQWLAHHRHHGTLPEQLAACQTPLQLLQYLGVDVFSRNLYCDQRRCWFGGLSEIEWEGVQVEQQETVEGDDLVIQRVVHTAAGDLTERLRYQHSQSTLTQVEQYSASFYQRASRICHEHGSTFFIHACGKQRANLERTASLGVDGLEGVAFPPLGDVQLDEALEMTGDRFIVTGGISGVETDRLQTPEEVFAYVEQLFGRLRPYAHRFIFASSCNTAITTRWEQLVWFRDAWREYGGL